MTMFFFFKSAFSAAFLLSGLVVTTPPLSSGLVTTFGFPTLSFFKTLLSKQKSLVFTAKSISGSLSFLKRTVWFICIVYLSGLSWVRHINSSLKDIGVRKSDLSPPHLIVFTNTNTLYNSKSPIQSGYLTVLHHNNIIFTNNKFWWHWFFIAFMTLLIRLNIQFSISSKSG